MIHICESALGRWGLKKYIWSFVWLMFYGFFYFIDKINSLINGLIKIDRHFNVKDIFNEQKT